LYALPGAAASPSARPVAERLCAEDEDANVQFVTDA
jgi:hypothetical protein